jgi:hypothetical protein
MWEVDLRGRCFVELDTVFANLAMVLNSRFVKSSTDLVDLCQSQ